MPLLNLPQTHAVVALAWRHLAFGRMQEACVLFDWLVRHMPARGDLRMALACAHLGCGQPETALVELGALESSNDPIAHFLRGKALARAGRMTEARLAFERYRSCRLNQA